MKLGAEPKKIAIFVGLIVLAAVAHFSGGDDPRPSSSPSATPAARPSAPPPAPGLTGPRAVPPTPARNAARPNSNRRSAQEFKPVLRPRRVEDRVDPASIDPTLRMDLLARLDGVPIQGGQRPLFEFGAAPPPKAPDPGKIIPGPPASPVKVVPESVKPPAPAAPAEAAKPQAPPIPLKFYGFTAVRSGPKRGFFLENDDVFVATEGDLVKKRYKVMRINMNSVVMEDTEFNQQQTLPLTEQLQ